ncbi:MAG: lysophospholipid acyltransferase family protein [Fusobacteria bacterium]|nr:lysophospholipid acyltransferase family protein [Fusobacteriota bacterium]
MEKNSKENIENDIKKDKSYKKYVNFGKTIYYLSKIIRLTMRMDIIKHNKIIKDKNYVYVFWHDKIFLPMVNMSKDSDKIVNMVSPSKDGQIIATALHMYNYKTVRGSSNKDSVRSLVELIRYVKDGYSAGFAADGPKGPIHKLKEGAIFLAKKTDVEIVPLGGAYSRKWIFKNSWDKFQFPKFFSKAVYILGEPIKIPRDGDVVKYKELIEQKLIELNEEAENLLIKKE